MPRMEKGGDGLDVKHFGDNNQDCVLDGKKQKRTFQLDQFLLKGGRGFVTE